METPHHGQKTVGETVVKLLGANPKRTGLLIVNNSGNTLYIGSKPTDVITSMLPIYTYGTYRNSHNQGAVYVIASDPTTDVRFEEDASD